MRLIGLGRVVGGAATLVALFAHEGRAAPAVGEKAVPFALRTLQGELISLADLAATRSGRRVVLLDFFRTDCEPCRRGLDPLRRIARRFAARPLKIAVVALPEEQDGEAKLKSFFDSAGLPFDVLFDAYGVVSERYIRSGTTLTLPSIFVIDRSGIVRGVFRRTDKQAERRLERLLEQLL